MANTILSVNDKRYIEIGYNIQYYRKHKNLTQERLAKLQISADLTRYFGLA